AARRAAPVLDRQGIELWVIVAGVPERAGLPDRVLARLLLGQPVSQREVVIDGRVSLAEGRPVGGGDALVLTRPFVVGVGAAVLSGLWLPLLVGVAAGTLVGTALAGRLSGPL